MIGIHFDVRDRVMEPVVVEAPVITLMANANMEPDYLNIGFGGADQSSSNSMLD